MFSKYMVLKRLAGQTSFRISCCLAVALFASVATPTGRPTRDGKASSSPRLPHVLEATRFSGSLVGVQYETWFTPGNAGSWETAEAVPVLGKYNSFDANVLREHAEWFEDLGCCSIGAICCGRSPIGKTIRVLLMNWRKARCFCSRLTASWKRRGNIRPNSSSWSACRMVLWSPVLCKD